MEILLQAAAPIPSHALVALLAGILDGLQLTRAKETRQHRPLGRMWVALMAYVAASSFFISEIKFWGSFFCPIHLLSGWTLFSLVMATYHARRGNIRQHKLWMVLLYVLALLVTGLVTLRPGREMHAVIFGT